MKSVSGTLKLSLAQFRELEAFVQFAQDLDQETAKRIDNGRRMVEILKQGKGSPMPFELQAAVLFAATKGFLDEVPMQTMRVVEQKLITYLTDQHDELLASIRDHRAIDEEDTAALRTALSAFTDAHAEFFVAPVSNS
jgi:F-type H+-transporting ATPase subunit alpha